VSYGTGGALTLVNVTVESNQAGAGGAHGSGGGPPRTGGAGGSGGGLSTQTAASVTNATIAGNSAGQGAPRENASDVSIPPVHGAGGGVSGPATLKNTILSSNNASAADRNCDAAVLDGGYNISFPDIPEAGCPVGFVHGDPLLAPLANNGGRTPTMAITNASSAYDHVPTTGAGCPALDQRGVGRPQFASCDAGAFELAPGPPPGDWVLTVSLGGSGTGTVTGTGINCGINCAFSYDDGSSVVLTATPASGSTFGGWTGCDLIAGSTCTMDMTADKGVTAVFNAPPPSTPPLAALPGPTGQRSAALKKCKKKKTAKARKKCKKKANKLPV
jgi:hypothetical protein